MNKITQVIKRTGAIVPFNPERITNAIYRAAVEVGGRDKVTAETLSRKVVEILENNTPDNGRPPHIEEIQDVVEKVLIENGHAKVAKAFILYRDERARHRKQLEAQRTQPSENIPWAKIWHVLDWSAAHNVHTVSELNTRLDAGEFPQIITESEAAYNVDVESAVSAILSRKEALKMVIITGPSSSGKTTTTIKVGQLLKTVGLKLVTLSVDNYFFDLEMHPKDEFGDYDFETPHALDLPLINQHLVKLIAGEEITVPFYDFRTGRRDPSRNTQMKLAENELILIDSLHGLFPAMTADIPNEQKFKLYLEPLLQTKGDDGEYVRWTDIRLIRRMLRDAAHRAYDPRQTLEHWHYVRSSEMRNILPYIHSTDAIVNSAMPYELPIYAQKMLGNFIQWTDQYKNNPLRQDAFERAERVAHLLASVHPIGDESFIPTDSVIREFIGGSSLQY
ncbi:Uridine kinase [bioreactor metagenome]|uniref:Uridine kinase n=1 Tax=bioreactor metagenome TaxID=1076179 RepID=A0A645ACJ6_9ZZZZ